MGIAGNSSRKSNTKEGNLQGKSSTQKREKDACFDDEGENVDSFGIGEKSIFIENSSSNEVASYNETFTLELLENDCVSAEEHLQNFLIQTLGKSDSRVYDIISKHGRKRTFYPKEWVLKSGETRKGIFIILDGSVEVMTSDCSEVINRLNAGAIFGDISTLFDIPVSANVKVSRDVTLVNLPVEIILDLFKNAKDLDIIDWFIQCRYLPSGTAVDSSRTYRRLALGIIKHLPLFSNWTDEMVKQLILLFEHTIVTLYPENSIIVLEQDPLTSVFVIISGKFQIKEGSRVIKTIAISPDSDPFVYTELALIVNGKLSPVTIKALSNCQVIHLKREWTMRVLERFPDHMDAFSDVARLFRISYERLSKIYLKNEADLQIELLCFYLKSSRLYSGFSPEQLWRLILNGNIREFEVGSSVLLETNPERYESIIVVRGEVKVIQEKVSNKIDNISGEFINFEDEWGKQTGADYNMIVDLVSGGNKTEQDGSKDGLNQTVAGYDSDKTFKSTAFASVKEDKVNHTLTAGSVIDVKTISKHKLSLIANTSCLILQLRTRAHTETEDEMSATRTPESDLKMV